MRKRKPTYHAEIREACGIAAHRAFLTIKENEKLAGRPILDADLTPWDQLDAGQREVFRRSGEDLGYGETPSEQVMWNELERRRDEMGEKAFREKMFSLCVSIAVEGVQPQIPRCDWERTVEGIVKMAGMLEVPPELRHLTEPRSRRS